MNPATGDVCPSCGGQVRWQAPSNQLPVGSLLRSNGGHVYQIGAAKGQGGFGITYAALDLMNQSRVAIKEYYPSRSASRDNVTRVIPATGQQESFQSGLRSFLEEGKMLSAVGALPSVVSVRDFFESNGTAYIVMEYVDGIPLHEVVRRKGRMSRDELFAILPALLRDIGILHRAGVIHRDISPDNLILTKEGKLKLLDFGSARSVESGKAMTVMLKAGFSPVEQYQSKGQGPYTDVYALAGTIYYCLTGVVPPTAIDRFGGEELKLPNTLGAGLTAQQQDALVWGMTVQAQARPQNMEAFANALFPAEASKPPVQTGQTPGYTGQTPGYTGQTPGYTGQTPGYVGQTPGYTGQTPGYTGQTPGYTGQTPGYVGQTPGYTGQTPGYTGGYVPQQPKKGFGKGLIIGITAAAVAVVVLVVAVLAGGLMDSGKKTPEREEEEDTYIRSETPVTVPGNFNTPQNTPQSSGSKTDADGYVYEIVGGEAIITGYVGEDNFLVFPDELDGCRVTVLGEGCLSGNTTIQSALLPLDCKEIRANAFYGCTELRDISSYSPAQVASSAFTGCLRLRAVQYSSDSNAPSWPLPANCLTFSSSLEMGIGELGSVDVDDNGVIYGLTVDNNAAILDIPNDITTLTVPEDRFGFPVLWVWEGALDHANPNLLVNMNSQMAFDYSLTYSAEWDSENLDDYSYSWYLTCVLCWDINDARTNGAVTVPDRLLVEAACIRAKELATSYDHIRPNGQEWSDLLNELEVNWDYGTTYNDQVDGSSETFDDDFDAVMQGIEESFTAPCESVGDYDALGAAMYYDSASDTLFINVLGTVWP